MSFFSKIFGKEKEKKAELPAELASLFNEMAERRTIQQKMFETQKTEFKKETTTKVEGALNGNYGLCRENPIFVNGFMSNDLYIGSLVTESGQPINWNRIGTDRCENVAGITDIYEGTLTDGTVYSTIFVNVYGDSTSTIAPKGLKIDKSGRSRVHH